MISPPIEGHHIISKRIIESASCAGIKHHTITLEPFIKELRSSKNCTIVHSKYYADNTGENVLVSAVSRVVNELVSSVNVASQIKSLPCDLVHVLNFTKEAYMITHKLLGVKKPLFIHIYHSPYVLKDDIFVFRNIALRSGLYGRLLENSVLSVNQSMVNFLITNLGFEPKRVHYVPCPIDTTLFKPIRNKVSLREKYGLPKDKRVIVYVGSLNTARGIIELMKSFRSVLSQNPETLLYISYPQHNTEATYETEVYSLIRSLGLQRKVVMSGPSQHVEEIYNLADVMVLPFNRPYWVDPPLVLLEAMSCGVPVITSSLGAISEVVREDENAVVVNPSDQESLAKAIVSLINDPLEASRVGEKARETIVQTNSYEVVGKKLLKIYSSVIR
jgi:glycosyltransferase involved in cell wall biosynthesis